MKTCDLHLHSIFSDGTCTPEQVVDLAIEAGLSAIALTDHNTVEGNERFLNAAKGRIETLLGCEFTTDFEGQELHLNGLFLDSSKLEIAKKALKEQQERKEKSNQLTIEALQADGYDVCYDEFISLFGTGSKNRVHIAKYLMDKGIISSRQEAFNGLLSKENKYYKEPRKFDFLKTIQFIKEMNGVSIWAHPLFHVDKKTCEKILEKATPSGLNGVEVLYTTYSEEDTTFMMEMAERYHLLKSGGSDFHGDNKPGVMIAKGYGNLEIPYDYYEEIKNLLLEMNKNEITKIKEFWNLALSNGEPAAFNEKWVEDESFNRVVKNYIKDGSNVLDYGTGQGWALFEIANTVQLGYGLGIDPSVNGINYSEKCCGLADFKNLEFKVGDETSLSKEEFDAVVSFNVLDVLPNDALPAILSAIKDALKPNGVFMMAINPNYPFELLQDIGYEKKDSYLYKNNVLRGNEKTKDEWIGVLSQYFKFEEYVEFALTDREKQFPRRMFIVRK